MSDPMIVAFNSKFDSADIDAVTHAMALGFFAHGWQAAEEDFQNQLADYVRRANDDLKTEKQARLKDIDGWVDAIHAEREKLLSLYQKIVDIDPAYHNSDVNDVYCKFCGRALTGHDADCLLIEALSYLEDAK